MLLHMIIHEIGHLICGLISGYKFSSFRIMNFILIQKNGKLKIKRLTIAGTGGQCLMAPPDMKDEKIPILLYNLGGPIFNLIAGIIFLLIFFILMPYPLVGASVFVFSLVGIIFAVLNGIPMPMGVPSTKI